MRKNFIKNLIFIATLLAGAVFAHVVFATITNGTIDTAYKYAWSENAGWINFGTSGGSVYVTDSGLTGYAWSENYGWINLSPSASGVKNDGSGNLSGYAWSEGLGWINFSGVTINTSGEFLGYATASIDNSQISFNCANTNSCSASDFKVKTDWRPRSVRPQCNNALDDDGDGKIDYPADPGCSSLTDNDERDPGGGLPATAYSAPASPSGGFFILINNGDEYTENLTANLSLSGGADSARMVISNFSDFRNAGQEAYSSAKTWNLCSSDLQPTESGACPEGQYTVYVKFYTQYGYSSGVFSDSIIYHKKTISEKIVKLVPEILQPLVPGFLKPSEISPPEIPLEKLLPKEAPLSLKGRWQLLPPKPIKEFVLAPLPKEILALTQKFPDLGATLKKVGIAKMTDLEKLKTAQLTLPGLTKGLSLLMPGIQFDKFASPESLPVSGIQPGKFALPAGIPVANLSMAAKQKIPTEIIFAKTGGGLVDYNIALSLTDQGKAEQKISTISGKPLQLAVKPGHPVKSVKGYVVFKSKLSLSNYSSVGELANLRVNQQPDSLLTRNKTIEEFSLRNLTASLFNVAQASEVENLKNLELKIPLNSLLGSMFFTDPVFAKPITQPITVEEKLVLMEFEYTDPDGDGIYTAEIQAPVVEGGYEIITVMDFKDPELGMKEIRLTAVVDPEGYVYEKNGDKETRIPGAIASLFWLNPATKQYELWPATKYQQENPQVTGVSGTYAFLVTEGLYYLKVEAPGYLEYDGKPFQVQNNVGVHMNIKLETKYWWLNIVDWKTTLLIAVMLLLLYNFYKDKARERLLHE